MKKHAAPALAAMSLPVRRGTRYPAPFDAPCAAREKRALGDAFGLADYGVNLVTLPPGSWSSQRHWHSVEDELIYVLEGEPVLVTDAGRTPLKPGMCAGFPGRFRRWPPSAQRDRCAGDVSGGRQPPPGRRG